MKDINKAIFSSFWKNFGYAFLFLLASILLIVLLVPKGIYSFFKWMFESAIKGIAGGLIIVGMILLIVFIFLKVNGVI